MLTDAAKAVDADADGLALGGAGNRGRHNLLVLNIRKHLGNGTGQFGDMW